MTPRRPAKGPPAEGAVTLAVRVTPRSAKNEVAGLAEGVVRIRLTAPPLENRANEALVRFLSRALGVPRSGVELAAGGKGRDKLVCVRGLSRAEAFRRLGLQEPPD